MLSIVAAFGLATAMDRTGVARAVAYYLVLAVRPFGAARAACALRRGARHPALAGAGATGDMGILVVLSVATTVVSLVISNNATVVLMFPVCFQAMLKSHAISPAQMFSLLAIVSSNSFAFPIRSVRAACPFVT